MDAERPWGDRGGGGGGRVQIDVNHLAGREPQVADQDRLFGRRGSEVRGSMTELGDVPIGVVKREEEEANAFAAAREAVSHPA